MERGGTKLWATWQTMSWMAGAKDDHDVRQDSQTTDEKETVPPAVPAPPYRHAAPSGPWPWMDFKYIDDKASASDIQIDKSWRGYPRNLFGNWTPDQVERSKMLDKCSKNQSSTIHCMDVLNDGTFVKPDMNPNGRYTVSPANEQAFWEELQRERPGNIRVRSLCVHDLTTPTLQMLGTRYNIEPFFFTSSVNWIPSRYQEAPTHGEGDHITVTLPFVRTLYSTSPNAMPPLYTSSASSPLPTRKGSQHSLLSITEDKQIDTQAPFHLQDDNMLFIDLLAIHMVRGVKTSTIISYHPESTWCRTSAERLHKLMMLVGDSVYWQHIFTKTKDPTFLFLTILWYALYAWDESFELLYKHVSTLESDVLEDSSLYQPLVNQEQQKDSPMKLTRQLHVLEAHLLHYQSLLRHFRISVNFIQGTPNPAMESEIFNDSRDISKELMERECKNLLGEIERLEMRREILSSRLKNAMDLAYATVNITDSRLTRRLTEATVRDSAAMRQISYLTMIFLPASLIASVFGMNVSEINPGSLETLAHYVETTICLTLFTVYIVVTLQPHSTIHTPGGTLLQRAAWPILFSKRWIQKKPDKSADDNV